ncbi:MFS-type transporter SLC18B1-like isoform X2 [Patiria miniata]|uniref:Major facilitator superfamily (MFS) profile domain-containing protein n=1 Tax=Patiria miniata TaxID=46514 RepID=A0A913ZN40_PATMI|nr:MFS-type transporter SLC18B1-like isoform X2 [Patiria miniata]
MESKSELNAVPSIEYEHSGEEAPRDNAQLTSSLANQDKADQDNDNTDKSPKEKPAPTKFTFNQKATFAGAVLASLASSMSFSIMAVFFPIEAKAKGMSQTLIGLVFTSFAFSSGIGSVIWGKIIPVLGARFVFLAGAFVTGGCNVLFGFLADMPTNETFTVFSFVIRLLEGLGSSATFTASSAIVSLSFPDNVGTAVSLVEMTSTLSYAIGPAIGGLLYDAGGFRLPFFVLGGFVLVIDGVNYFVLPQQGTKKKESGPMARVLSIPGIWVCWLAVFVAAIASASIDPTVSIHLKELDFTVLQISLLFLGFGTVGGIFGVVWGTVADAKKATRIMIVIGAFASAVFFLLLGPSPLLNIPSTKLLAILVFLTGPAMTSLVVVPTFVDMFGSAASFVGPMVGSALTEAYGFGYATTFIAGLFVFVMIVVTLFGAWEYRCGKGRRVPRSRLEMEANTTNEEQKPLISSDV